MLGRSAAQATRWGTYPVHFARQPVGIPMAQEFDAYHKWLGIPPEEQPPNHYRLLGLADFESDLDVIDAAANQRMSYVRECATGPYVDLSQSILNHISGARLELLQPEKKAKYDTGLKEAAESHNLAAQAAAALGGVTDFQGAHRQALQTAAPPPEGVTWHLPVYVVAACVLLGIGIFVASSVGSKLLAKSTTFTDSITAETIELEEQTARQKREADTEIDKKREELGSKVSSKPLVDDPNAGSLPQPTLDDSDVNAGSSLATGSGDIALPAEEKEPEIEKFPIPTTEQVRKAKERLKKRHGHIKRSDQPIHVTVLLNEVTQIWEGDPNTQWESLDQAMKLAVAHLDYARSIKALEQLEKRYFYEEGDIENLRADEIIRPISRKIKPKDDLYKYFCDESLQFLDRLIEKDRLELAMEVYESFKDLRSRTESKRLERDLRERQPAMQIAKQYAKPLTVWNKMLNDDNEKNDAVANKALGLFYLCVKEDNKRGFEFLKNSSDKALVRAAELASKEPTTTEDFIELGMAWRKAAKRLKGKGIQQHKSTLGGFGRARLIEGYTRAIDDEKKTVEKVMKDEGLLIVNSIGMRLMYVPAGEYIMGTPITEPRRQQFALRDEISGKRIPLPEDEHPVRLTHGFYMGMYEVTQREFEGVMGHNPSEKNEARAPVTNVNIKDAKKFLMALSQVDNGRPYRLPTEAEWEYACRAGTTSAFAFGAKLKQDQATFGLGEQEAPTPVGSYQPNAFGLFDMHGNVAEWTNDYYLESYYTKFLPGVATNPTGPKVTGLRIVRGGGFDNTSGFCRSGARFVISGNKMRPWLGFRVLMPASN